MEIFHGVKDIPRGEGHGVSSHKYELSERIPMGLTMKEKQAVTKRLALDYKRAGKKEKGKILDTVIELECEGHRLHLRLLLEESS